MWRNEMEERHRERHWGKTAKNGGRQRRGGKIKAEKGRDGKNGFVFYSWVLICIFVSFNVWLAVASRNKCHIHIILYTFHLYFIQRFIIKGSLFQRHSSAFCIFHSL